MSIRKHYLSRCIIKNFQEEDGSGTFFEYDCLRGTSQRRNIDKLFAGYHYWSDEFEKILGAKYENDLALVLKKYAGCPIKPSITLGKEGLICKQFNGFQIQDEHERKVLSKLIFQCILTQQKNSFPDEKTPEDILEAFFSSKGLELQYPMVMEIAPNFGFPPLILLDNIVFTFLSPSNKKGELGHACFMCPISSSRLIIWGTKEDCDFFTLKYKNINYLNLCMIEQQSKECRFASQNEAYITWLSKRIKDFNSQEKIKITACRNLSR